MQLFPLSDSSQGAVASAPPEPKRTPIGSRNLDVNAILGCHLEIYIPKLHAMFDVYWTDHNRELVGERVVRKAREEREGKAREGNGRQHENARHSVSTNSSASSDRAFGVFGGRARKKTAGVSRLECPPIFADSVGPANNEEGIPECGVDKLADGVPDLTLRLEEGQIGPRQPHVSLESCSSPSSRGSGMSKWTQPSLTASSSLASGSPRTSFASRSESCVQVLGPASFIIKSTQIMIAPRATGCKIKTAISEIIITSERVKIPTPLLEDLPEEGASLPFDESDTVRLLTRLPTTPTLFDHTSETDHAGDVAAWKSTHEWDCGSPREIPTPSLEANMLSLTMQRRNDHYISPSLPTLQREVHMMAAATPELMLANLNSGMSTAEDARVYKELELTKKRWMFSALHQSDKYGARLHQSSFHPGFQKSPRLPRVLAMYETHASVTFLAALHPDVKITHLSLNPVSPTLFPNTQPMQVSTVSVSAISRQLPPQLFSSVTCLSMPSLFASTEIPSLLRNIHRCLTPGGALHLTVIDPEPVPGSVGPKFRQWLINHLLTDLEAASRTTLPSSIIPPWLAVSCLRGKGSTIASLSVPAVPEGFSRIAGVRDSGPVRAELRCKIMRMLWQEIWGRFVHAPKWWWEEDEILQECVEYGTYWIYSHVVAVKDEE